MAKKVRKGTYWISCVGEVFEVKSVYGGFVWGYGYSRSGRQNDEIEKVSVKDFLSVCSPCNVEKTIFIDKNGNKFWEECRYLEVKGDE